MTTTQAGLVSRESVRELLLNEIETARRRKIPAAVIGLSTVLAKIDELPAIGVSDAMVQAALDTFGMPPSFHAMKKALRAALHPTGEDRE